MHVGGLSKSLLDQAEGYRTLVEETPAFAIAEENLSKFNELTIIENWIFRKPAAVKKPTLSVGWPKRRGGLGFSCDVYAL